MKLFPVYSVSDIRESRVFFGSHFAAINANLRAECEVPVQYGYGHTKSVSRPHPHPVSRPLKVFVALFWAAAPCFDMR